VKRFLAGTIGIAKNYFLYPMTVGHPIRFSILPQSLVAGIGKTFVRFHLEMKILELASLRELVRQKEEETLRREWLHPQEQETVSALIHKKRHVEWLGGRICVKEALLAFLKSAGPLSANVSAPRLQIVTAPSGRPMLRQGAVAGKMAAPHISISHSGEYAMAVAAAVPCGIDIQENRDALSRVKEKFCGAAEEKMMTRSLAALAPSEHLTLLWAAKESVKKGAILDRMPGFLELKLYRIDTVFTPDRQGCFLFSFAFLVDNPGRAGAPPASSPQFQALVCLHQGYGIGLCLSSSHGPARKDYA
jgi:phosphopantetheinyl transferase (holo-ACP synthase)